MHHRINAFFTHERLDKITIDDIALDKSILLMCGDKLQAGWIASIRQGIQNDDRSQRIRDYARKHGAAFRIGVATREQIKKDLDISINIIPSHILLDAKGNLLYAESGLKEIEDLKILVDELLAADAPQTGD